MAAKLEKIKFAPTLTKQDKEKMKQQFDLIALRIPCENIGKIGQSLKQYTFQRKGVKPFQADPENVVDSSTNKSKFKCLLLNDSIKTSELDGIPKNVIELINECQAKAINFTLDLDYDKLSTMEVLKSIIHKDMEGSDHAPIELNLSF